jgi:hypothetical protein
MKMRIPEMVVLILIALNFSISWFNAYSVGRSWADSKAIGGWPRFLVWCGAVMSASGFTWCYLILVSLGAGALGFLPAKSVRIALELGYVFVILLVLGSGIAIWMDSLTTAWRRRDAASVSVAGWNTFAMAHDTYEAATTLPRIFTGLASAASEPDDDAEGKVFALAFYIIILTLCSGILTTTAIIRSTAKRYAQEVLAEHGHQRRPAAAA